MQAPYRLVICRVVSSSPSYPQPSALPMTLERIN